MLYAMVIAKGEPQDHVSLFRKIVLPDYHIVLKEQIQRSHNSYYPRSCLDILISDRPIMSLNTKHRCEQVGLSFPSGELDNAHLHPGLRRRCGQFCGSSPAGIHRGAIYKRRPMFEAFLFASAECRTFRSDSYSDIHKLGFLGLTFFGLLMTLNGLMDVLGASEDSSASIGSGVNGDGPSVTDEESASRNGRGLLDQACGAAWWLTIEDVSGEGPLPVAE